MNQNQIKFLFHLTMVGAAVWEFSHSRTVFRKQLCGAFGGFHAASALIDVLYPDEDRKIDGRETGEGVR